MWLLPANVAGDRTVRLPLTDRAARDVSATLLIEDAERRMERWRELLSEVPPLLLWALGSASGFRDAPPRSLQQVAVWCDTVGLAGFACVERAVEQENCAISAEKVAAARESALTGWETSDEAAAWFAARILDVRPIAGDATDRDDFTPAWLARAVEARRGGDDEQRLATPCMSGEPNSALDCGHAYGELLAPLARRLLRERERAEDFSRQLLAAKLASLKELAYGASHEINNPLANIATRAQSLLADERDVERRRKLATIAAQAYRAHEMISDLMLFARPQALRRERTELGTLVDKVLSEFAEQARQQRVTLTRIGGESSEFFCSFDSTQMAVAVQALVRNSLESLDGPGRVEVAIAWCAADPATGSSSLVRIAVRDDGPGVSPRAAEHLFDPFFSGREAGRGLGFGLSKCWRIVTAHGGQVRHEPTADRGALFVIEIPAELPKDEPATP